MRDGYPHEFRAVEYGAGDNSYGAIFSLADGKKVAGIHDSDLELK